MNKTPKAVPKADITAPKRKVTAAQPLVIPKRSIIGDAKPSLTEDEPQQPMVSPVAHKAVQPVTLTEPPSQVSASDAAAPAEPTAAPQTPDGAAFDQATSEDKMATDAANGESPMPAVATEDEPAVPAAQEPKDSSEDEPAAAAPVQETSTETATDEPAAGDAGNTPSPNEQEQLKKTAEAVKRERELQEYVKNQKYFVPVNTSARKRSIKVSFGLVFLLLLLAFVLIDLLLDTGAILLVQKIPHTHFFNLYNRP